MKRPVFLIVSCSREFAACPAGKNHNSSPSAHKSDHLPESGLGFRL